MNLPAPNPLFVWNHEPWGHALRCRPLQAVAQHLFTSRQLRLLDPAGWESAAASLSATPDRLVRVRQVHGNVVHVRTRGQSPTPDDDRPAADAIASNEPGLVLAVMVADCVPILLADPVTGSAAAIHAGWRGTCAGVGPAAVAAMQAAFGTVPANLVAAIGPSIGPEDYEVDEPLVESFRAAGHSRRDIARWFRRGQAKPHLDLWSANRDQLEAAGVAAAGISSSGLSTLAHLEVFDSYRAEGARAGRMAAMIVVPTPAAR
jgi:YfiH family protein